MKFCELFGIGHDSGAEALLMQCVQSHKDAAINNQNLSSTAFTLASYGGSPVLHCMAAALCTTGSVHAPVERARDFLFQDGDLDSAMPVIMSYIEGGTIIPGFGNDFYKDRIDPAFVDVFHMLPDGHREFLNVIAAVITRVKKTPIFPNAAGITAAVADCLGLPPAGEALIFLIGRASGWITL